MWCCPCPATCAGWPRGRSSSATPWPRARRSSSPTPHDPATAVGLVPEFSYDDVDDDSADFPELCALAWTVYSLPGAPVLDHHELGDAEYTLRSAVRSAADALGAIGLGSAAADIDDPRGLVEQLLESARQHRVPDHAPSRALRVLENAAHVDAIIAVSAGLSRSPDSPERFAAPVVAGPEPFGAQSSSEARIASDALRPLTAVVRSARMAASPRSCTRPGPISG